MVEAIRKYLRAFLGVPDWTMHIHAIPKNSSILIVVPESYSNQMCQDILDAVDDQSGDMRVVVLQADELSVLRIK